MTRRRLSSVLGVVLLQFLVAHRGKAQQASTPGGTAPAAESPPSPDAPIPLSAFTAVGSDMALGNRLDQMGWNEAQIDAFIEGVRAAFHGRPVPLDDDARKVSKRIFERIAEIESREKEERFAKPGFLKKYLDDISKRLGLQQSDSGLCYQIQPGTMETRAGPGDTVVVSCAAFAVDGVTLIPELTNKKVRTRVSEMLPGLAEGVQMMSVGGQGIFVVPPSLSFGSGSWPAGADRGTPLIFRITLIEVVNSAAPR
jgi:FKBP-type peptidyl-prolyl cis-trans isomerase FkpA/FKBP-type peptidyl-prolyl cis-trans isomerase FklB